MLQKEACLIWLIILKVFAVIIIPIITARIAYSASVQSAKINNDHLWEEYKSQLDSDLTLSRQTLQNEFDTKLTEKKARLEQSTKFIEKSFEIHKKFTLT